MLVAIFVFGLLVVQNLAAVPSVRKIDKNHADVTGIIYSSEKGTPLKVYHWMDDGMKIKSFIEHHELPDSYQSTVKILPKFGYGSYESTYPKSDDFYYNEILRNVKTVPKVRVQQNDIKHHREHPKSYHSTFKYTPEMKFDDSDEIGPEKDFNTDERKSVFPEKFDISKKSSKEEKSWNIKSHHEYEYPKTFHPLTSRFGPKLKPGVKYFNSEEDKEDEEKSLKKFKPVIKDQKKNEMKKEQGNSYQPSFKYVPNEKTNDFNNNNPESVISKVDEIIRKNTKMFNSKNESDKHVPFKHSQIIPKSYQSSIKYLPNINKKNSKTTLNNSNKNKEVKQVKPPSRTKVIVHQEVDENNCNGNQRNMNSNGDTSIEQQVKLTDHQTKNDEEIVEDAKYHVTEDGDYKKKRKHNLTSKSTGFHNVFYKDEYKKEKTYFDKLDDTGHHNKYPNHRK